MFFDVCGMVSRTRSASLVIGGHQGAVGGAGRVEVIGAIGQFDAQVLDASLQVLDCLRQLDRVRGIGWLQ